MYHWPHIFRHVAEIIKSTIFLEARSNTINFSLRNSWTNTTRWNACERALCLTHQSLIVSQKCLNYVHLFLDIKYIQHIPYVHGACYRHVTCKYYWGYQSMPKDANASLPRARLENLYCKTAVFRPVGYCLGKSLNKDNNFN